jgi:hypothetical protein
MTKAKDGKSERDIDLMRDLPVKQVDNLQMTVTNNDKKSDKK